MAPDVRMVPATREHAIALAPQMRAADAAEVLAAEGQTPLEALDVSLEASAHAFALIVGGDVAAMWGVVDLAEGGLVWALTGEAVARRPIVFWRQSRIALGVLLRHYDLLFNYVDARYEAAIRWVRRLGFEVQEAQPFGKAGLPFHPVVMRRRTAWAA